MAKVLSALLFMVYSFAPYRGCSLCVQCTCLGVLWQAVGLRLFSLGDEEVGGCRAVEVVVKGSRNIPVRCSSIGVGASGGRHRRSPIGSLTVGGSLLVCLGCFLPYRG